jgi:hypothetical protein
MNSAHSWNTIFVRGHGFAVEQALFSFTSGGVFRPRKIVNGTWPDYERTLAGARPNQDGTGPDRCMTGFFWCMLAAQRGWTIEETAHKLVEVSARAQEGVRLKDQGYGLSPLTMEQQRPSAANSGARARTKGAPILLARGLPVAAMTPLYCVSR